MEITTGNLRLVVSTEGEVSQLRGDQPPPGPDDAVFICRPVSMAFAMRGPIGESESDAARERGSVFLSDVVREHVIGWENVRCRDTNGELTAAPFDVEHLISGVVPPTVGAAIATFLLTRASARNEARRGNALSGISPSPRPRSGAAGQESRIAEPATSSA